MTKLFNQIHNVSSSVLHSKIYREHMNRYSYNDFSIQSAHSELLEVTKRFKL